MICDFKNKKSEFYKWFCKKLLISQKEQRICLNSYSPSFVPADVNNPTIDEVKAWVNAKLDIWKREHFKYLKTFDLLTKLLFFGSSLALKLCINF